MTVALTFELLIARFGCFRFQYTYCKQRFCVCRYLKVLVI